MAVNVLVINGIDYTKYIQDGGYSWSRDDLDTDKTTRTKDGTMRRDKITQKRNLTYNMLQMPEELAAQLDSALQESQFSVTYRDLHGQQTREFYCSKFPANLRQIIDEGNIYWEGISFNLHEI